MKTCRACGFHNTGESDRCFRCRALLGLDPLELPNEGRTSLKPVRLPRRSLLGRLPGQAALGNARRGVADFFRRLFEPPSYDAPSRNPFLAGALSLLPGVGQWYNGQPRKAILFALVWIGVIAAIYATFFNDISTWVVRASLIWGAYAFHDGFKIAIMTRRQWWNVRLSVMVYFAWLFQMSVASLAVQYVLTEKVLRLRYITTNALAPMIQPGERIMIDRITYKFRNPIVGELVTYDPDSIPYEVGEDRVLVDPTEAMERIVAGPGETFEMKGGAFFRNGQPIPDSEGPILRGELSWDFKLTAPPDHYIILITRGAEGKDWILQATAKVALWQAVRDKWAEACVVHRKKLHGRIIGVYAPPSHRRWIRRWDGVASK